MYSDLIQLLGIENEGESIENVVQVLGIEEEMSI